MFLLTVTWQCIVVFEFTNSYCSDKVEYNCIASDSDKAEDNYTASDQHILYYPEDCCLEKRDIPVRVAPHLFMMTKDIYNRSYDSHINIFLDTFRTQSSFVPTDLMWPFGQDLKQQSDTKDWNYSKGMILDISEIFGEHKVIYTTVIDDTFYLIFTCTEGGRYYWVTLIIDGRDGWNYGFKNVQGHFEYKHGGVPYILHPDRTMLDFPGDYSQEGIAPDGHLLGIMERKALRDAIKTLSEYDGTVPAPPEIRKACGVLVNYGCEPFKLHPSLKCTSFSLLDENVFTIGDCFPLSNIMKK
jgi:hypothetical protein